MLAAVLLLGVLLLLFGYPVGVFLRVTLQMAVHSVDILDTETSGEYGHLHLLAQFRVGSESPLYLEVAEFGHEVVHVVHLFHHQAVLSVLLTAERDAEKYLLGVENVIVVQQRRVQGVVNSLLHTSFTLTVTGAHDGHTAVFQYRLNIVEVKVYQSVYGDNLGNALGSHAQCVVGLAESVEHCKLRIYLTQPFIVDNEQRINVLRHLFHAVESLVYLAVALETERYGHYSHREDAHLLADTGYHGSGAGTCSTAHSGCYERHASAVVEHVLYVF